MELFLEILVSLFILIGGSFVFVGSLGMVKLPDLMTRLHAPTKVTTLGMGGILLASVTYFFMTEGKISIHEALITVFLFLTAPVTAHFIAKGYMHRHQDLQKVLPKAKNDSGWGTYED